MNLYFEGLSLLRVRFLRETRGGIAILFALLFLPLVTGAFLAIDYGRATSMKSSLQNAADAAVVTAALRLGGDTVDVQNAFKAAFRANLPDALKDQPYSLSIANDEKSLSVKMNARIETTLIKVVGLNEIRFDLNSYAQKPKLQISRRLNSGGGPEGALSGQTRKDQIIREIQEGLQEARRLGLPVPANLDEQQIERLAEALMDQMGRH